MDNKKKHNPYIHCDVNGSHCTVNMNGNDKVLIAMACTIIFDLANIIGEDLEKFAYKLADMTVEVANKLQEELHEEDKSSGNSAQSTDTMLSF